jgi:hypothetical protein
MLTWAGLRGSVGLVLAFSVLNSPGKALCLAASGVDRHGEAESLLGGTRLQHTCQADLGA